MLLNVKLKQYNFLKFILVVELIVNSSFNFSCNCQFQLELNFSCHINSIPIRLQLIEMSHFNYELQIAIVALLQFVSLIHW